MPCRVTRPTSFAISSAIGLSALAWPKKSLFPRCLFSFLDFIDFHYFVAVVVDDFDGDLAGLGLVKGAADGGIKGLPGRFVNIGPEGAFELFVGLIGTGEIGVADEEALAVAIGVNEPAGDVVGAAVATLSQILIRVGLVVTNSIKLCLEGRK